MARYKAVEEAGKLADKQLSTLRAALTRNETLQSCSGCGQHAQKDWTYCPYCGAQERREITK